jgi:hypothetical protein
MFGILKSGKKLAAAALLAAAAFAGAGKASAADVSVGLETLMPGGSNAGGITVGDKRYSNFQFSSSGSTVLHPEDVEVMIMSSGNRHDLFFMFGLSASGGQRSDLVLGYDLTVIGPNTIRRVDTMFDGSPLGPASGRGAVSMVETVTMLDGNDLAPGGPVQDTEILNLFNDGDEGGLPDFLEAGLNVNATRSLRFTKDIIVSSRANGPTMDLSVVQQGVEQSAIPLPAAFWAAMPVFGAVVGRKKLRRLLPSRA